MVVSFTGYSQKEVIAFIQSPSNDGKDLYYSMKFGLKTTLDNDIEWIKVSHDVYYNVSWDAIITLRVYEDAKKLTLDFINEVKEPSDRLYVYISHNVLLDTTINTNYHNCSDNALIGCMTAQTWFLENTIINTVDFVAPESYVSLTAIESWLNEDTSTQTRKRVSERYAYYQGKRLRDAETIFGL